MSVIQQQEERDLLSIISKAGLKLTQVAITSKKNVVKVSDKISDLDASFKNILALTQNITNLRKNVAIRVNNEIPRSQSPQIDNTGQQNPQSIIDELGEEIDTLNNRVVQKSKKGSIASTLIGALPAILALGIGASRSEAHEVDTEDRQKYTNQPTASSSLLPPIQHTNIIGSPKQEIASTDKKSATRSDQKQNISMLHTTNDNRFVNYISKTIQSVTKYTALFPTLLAPLAAGYAGFTAGQDFAEGITDGYDGVQSASGNSATKQAMDFFMSQKWTKEQAAGLVGNLQVESGNFASDVVSGRRRGDNGAAVGIAQWHPDRQNVFRSVFKRPLVGASLEQQLQFVQYELNNNEKAAGDALRRAKSAKDAAIIVDRFYERSSGDARRQRIVNAQALAGDQSLIYRAGRYAGSTAKSVARPVQEFFNSTGITTPPGNVFKYVTLLNSGVSLNVNSQMLKRFTAMAYEYNRLTGKKIQVNSGFRTYEQQARLFTQYGQGRAARPGNSRHEAGLAIDIQSSHGNALDKMGLFSKYGFIRPVRGEPWHIEPVEGANIKRMSNVEEWNQAMSGTHIAKNSYSNQTKKADARKARIHKAFTTPQSNILLVRGRGSQQNNRSQQPAQSPRSMYNWYF